MKRADKEHLKRVIIVLLIASMLVGTSQVPPVPYVNMTVWAYDDIDLLNAAGEGNILIGDIPEEGLPADAVADIADEEVFKTDTTGGIAEGDDLQADTFAGIAEEDDLQADTTVSADDVVEVNYIDSDGETKSHSATVLTGSETELDPGWYVVSGNIVFHHSVSMNKQGEYNIILKDDGKMSIVGAEHDTYLDTWSAYENEASPVGLGCLYDNNSKIGINLTIYGQQNGTGELYIYNSNGSQEGRPVNEKVGDAINVDDLTINGGKICLEGGGTYSNGITSKNLTINGGEIKVEASSSGYGISSTGDIIINGGKITTDAVRSTGEIIINNGEIKVTAKSTDNLCGLDAKKITINNGKVTANATGRSGHAINSTENIMINGGTVTATATGHQLEFGDLGGCGLNAGGNITISGNVTTVTATTTGGGSRAINSTGDIIINGGTITANTTINYDFRDVGGWAIHSGRKLTISGGSITAQSGGSDAHAVVVDQGYFTIDNRGKLTAVAKGDGNGLYVGKDIIINGGEIKASSNDSNRGWGIKTSAGDIKIQGGQIDAKGAEGGINGYNLTLSWKNVTDYISTNSLSILGDVTIERGKAFTDGNGNYYVTANASEVKTLTTLSATSDTVHVVEFDVMGGSHATSIQVVSDGSLAQKPEDDPEKENYVFAGWYDTSTHDLYDFDSKVKGNLQLYAKWINESDISRRIEDCTIQEIYRKKDGDIDPVVWNNVGIRLNKGTDFTSGCERIGQTDSYTLTINGTGDTSSGYYGTKIIKVIKLTYERYDTEKNELVTDTLPEGKIANKVTSSTVSMNSGWYVVTEDVKVESRMVVKGDVHLVLCDGTTLDAGGNGGTMGISVTEGNSLTIYSQAGNTGKLKASSNEVNYYAGIGGDAPDTNDNRFPYLAENKNAGNITIHGGEIIARGSNDSAAIGMADEGKGGKITIYGGKITAERFARTGASATDNDTGIGGRDADIHIAWCRNPGDFILSDGYQGTVTFDKPYINGSSLVTKDNINDFSGQKIEPIESDVTYTVSFNSNGGTAVEAQPVAMGRTAAKPITPIKQGCKFDGWYQNSDFNGGAYDFSSTQVSGNLILHAKWSSVTGISFISANNTNIDNFTAYSPMEVDYEVLPSGYYYVGENVSLLNRIKVKGEVSLILGDGKTLTALKGISVMGRDTTLNIFGQSEGDNAGVLKANAEDNSAAIGGDGHYDSTFGGSVGNINIYGGIIRPQGGDDAAAIGGGRNNEYYGNICIYGGEVSGAGGTNDPALGGSHGAAIGSGFAGETTGNEVDGTVEIHGGKVTVKSNTNGTGIGGGHNAYGGTINILGGQVRVTVSYNEDPGIGDGYQYNGEKHSQITLGCREGQDDFIYSAQYNGNVRVAPNQALKIINTSTTFQGVISDLSGITNETLVLGHAHSFKYTVSGTTITATCQNDGCDLTGKKATLTLSAPDAADLIYDGTGKPPIVIDEHSISGDEVICYQKKNGDSWDAATTEAPKEAGDYKASLTLTDIGTGSTATVSTEYTIEKRNVTIIGLKANNKTYDDTTDASVDDSDMVLDNKIDDDEVNIVAGNANFVSESAGDNKTVTFRGYSLTGAAAGNYNLVSQPGSVSANIQKRPVTITARNQTVQVGEDIKKMAANFDQGTDRGMLVDKSHALTALTLTPDPDPRSCNTPTEDGTITPSGAVIKNTDTDRDVTENYVITYVSGKLTIIMPRAKVTKIPTVRKDLKYEGYRYNQALVEPGEAETKMEYYVQQIAKGDGIRIEYKDKWGKSTGKYVDEDPIPEEGYGDNYKAWESGTYRVWYRAASDNSHAPSEPEYISVNIATVPLKVKVEDETIPFGERFPSMNAIEEGFVHTWDKGAVGMRLYEYLINGEWKSANEAQVTSTYPDLGMYPARIDYDLKGDVSYCYRYIKSDGYLTVVPRTVDLNWGNTTFTFNGQSHVPTVSLSNLSANETSTIGVTVSGAQVNAGDYTATAVALTGDKAAKYALPSDNTKAFSIAKANYSGYIPNVEINVPVSADSYTASVAGKMPRDAGKLKYSVGTVSSDGFSISNNDYTANVDKNGLLTVSRNTQDSPPENKKLYVSVEVESTNYEDKSITVEATFVNKSDAGVSITSGNSLSVNYGEVDKLNLQATVSQPGTSDVAWSWDSSNTDTAEVAKKDNGYESEVTVKKTGTTGITAKYDSNTATGYATLLLSVNPISVSIPSVNTELVYDGTEKTGVVSDSAHYDLDGEKGTYPGDYVAIATLKDTENHRWSDGTIEAKYIPWSIEKEPGPEAPTGLEGIKPTTPENLDGKITGVNTYMEYSKDPNFSYAMPCTGTTIIGLTDGTWYVRIRETEFVKAGAAASVVIQKVLPPVVRAKQGLAYNGSPQVIVEADTVSKGTLYYAVTGRNDPKPDEGQYTTKIPKRTNAGEYRVWYEVRDAGVTLEEGGLYVDIAQKDLRNVFFYISMSPDGIYGTEGMIDIRAKVPEDKARLRIISADTWGCITEPPTIDNPKEGATTMRIHYNAARDEDLPVVSEGVLRYVSFTVSVDEMVNYHAYNMTVKTTFHKECATNHRHAEQLNADHFWCHDCHGIFEGRISSGGGGSGDTDYAVTVTNGTGTGSYKAGSSVVIRADEPEEGKRFKEWEGADDLIFTTGSKTTANAVFTMPEREVSLKAIYEDLPAENYTVFVTDDGHGIGSAYPAYGKSGTKVSLLAQPSAGYKFKEWQVVSGNIIITEDSFIIGEENVIIKAVFEEDEDHIHEYTSEVTKEPTCTEPGINTFTCECGDSYTEEIPALGHDYAVKITRDPTTEADGEKTYTCKRCGRWYIEAIPKLSDSLLLYEKVKSSYEIRVSKKLVVGKGFTLVPKFASGKVVNERVVWESTNPDVATVTQDGKLKAISGGETTVFVRSEENPELTAYCIITVTDPVTEITLDKSRVSFGSGEKATLTAEVLPYTAQQELVFSTTNASTVILCDARGNEFPGTMNGKQKIYDDIDSKTVYVKAVGAGSAKVTAAAVDGSGKKCSCSFSVGNPVPEFGIHGKGNATEVKAGKTLAMQIEWAGAKPKNTDVNWLVSSVDGKNSAFTASISDKGVLTGITTGKVRVIAVSKANPEISASAEISVSAPEKGNNPEITAIRLTNADEIKNKGLNIGKSYTLKTLLTTSGTGKAGSDAVAWISSDSNVATVSQKGVVKAVAPGRVTIIAVPRDAEDISSSPKDSVTFSVYAPVKKVKLDKTKLTVGTQTESTYGKIGIAAVTPKEATNPAIMWTANNSNVQLAAILKNGSPAEGSFAAAGGSVITDAGYALAVKAIAPGVTKLTGITTDGSKKKVTCTVTVRGEVTGIKFSSNALRMKAGSGMTLKPIIDINGISGSSTDKTDKNKYKTYKKYTDTSVSYRSSDTSVLTVNKNGKISVNKNASGKSAIVYAASADGKYSEEIKITVD